MDNKGYIPEHTPVTGSYHKRDSEWDDPPPISGHTSLEVDGFDEADQSLTLEKNQITFSWTNISITIPARGSRKCLGLKKGTVVPEKTILKNVSGYCQPGEVLAIMGASGAGKSTLLNALTFRNLNGLRVDSGQRYANGTPVTPNSLTSVSAYVQQDDLFIGTLTVREHLTFQAKVRMDKDIPFDKRMERVEEVMRELGLTKCADTLIGVQGRIKGISGGESKRLAFASEVLTNPPLMFCDEPTSGLDSYMAQNVVEVLRDLSRHGKTIVCTIHQPSSQVFALFDRLLLMAEGRVAFLGSTTGAMEFFSSIGRPCPSNYNPADHYVHVLAVTPGKEEVCRANVAAICDKYEESSYGQTIKNKLEVQLQNARDTPNLNASKNKSPYKASWWAQFKAVLWRSFLSVIKEPMIMQVRIIQTIIVALLLGVIYLNQENDQAGVQNINGALFLLLTNVTFQNMFAVVNVFCMELPIFLREHFNGMYRTDVYFITKQLAELPLFIFVPIGFVSIFYYMVGMNYLFERFVMCNVIILLVTQVVVGFGYFISCISPSLQVALGLAPPLIIPFMLFGGFFLNNQSVPSWLIWLQYISWFKYGNEALVINQWEGVKNITQVGNGTSFGFSSGDEVLLFYGYDPSNLSLNLWLLGALAVGFRIAAFIALLLKTFRRNPSK